MSAEKSPLLMKASYHLCRPSIKFLLLAGVFQLVVPCLIHAETISEGTVVSPKKSFAITQTRDEEGVLSKLTFKDSKKSFILQPSPIDWRGFYTISPDEKWILRIQKTGSGDNNAWLYEVKNGAILPEQDLGVVAWNFHEKVSPFKHVPLYHTGFEFVEWDSEGTLVLAMHGTSDDQIQAHHVRDFVVKFKVLNKTFARAPSLQ